MTVFGSQPFFLRQKVGKTKKIEIFLKKVATKCVLKRLIYVGLFFGSENCFLQFSLLIQRNTALP
nr:MAG TPA_asm: hypothetical protein [Caudoviricetes sp.]